VIGTRVLREAARAYDPPALGYAGCKTIVPAERADIDRLLTCWKFREGTEFTATMDVTGCATGNVPAPNTEICSIHSASLFAKIMFALLG